MHMDDNVKGMWMMRTIKEILLTLQVIIYTFIEAQLQEVEQKTYKLF